MTPRDQLVEHCPEQGRYGDCYRTCIASILDLPTEAVPNFFGTPESFADAQIGIRQREAWLEERGLVSTTFAWAGEMSLEDVLMISAAGQSTSPIILCGRSSLGCNHSVVVMGGQIVCDPSGNGIVGPLKEGTWELEVLAVGPNWRGRTEPPPAPARRLYADGERHNFLRPADVPARRVDLSGRDRFVFQERVDCPTPTEWR